MTETVEKPIEEREAERTANEIIAEWLDIGPWHDPGIEGSWLLDKIAAAILSAQSSLRERIGELEEAERETSKTAGKWMLRAEAAEAKVERLRKALTAAKIQLVTLGGDPRAVNGNGDEVQHSVLETISAALRDTETVG